MEAKKRIASNKKENFNKEVDEYLKKTIIEYLKKSLLYLNAADGMIGRIHTDAEQIQGDRDIIGYSRVEIEDLLKDYEG